MHVSIGENAGLFTSVLTEKGVFCVFRVSAPVFFEGLMDGVKYCVLWPDGVKYCVLWPDGVKYCVLWPDRVKYCVLWME